MCTNDFPMHVPTELEGERCTTGDGERCAASHPVLSSSSTAERREEPRVELPWERGRGDGQRAANDGHRVQGVGGAASRVGPRDVRETSE